ncbi:hypothetical protein CU097_003565 [Rhizopus azygosporus]|uniref:Major facilitator superfamily (MFS) profile domain-containing protein n=1 Tax=Rhizopus azygosporus TaxID=86630 RepID=A0A367IYT0_RHIAZ|nr:hypothetical protein CU097_003565 [Rhizopus azygosporus]
MITYSIIVPILPFTIDAIERGRSPNNPGYDPYHSELHDPGGVSKQSGALLALFSVGLIAGSLGFGYLGDRLKHRQGLMLVGILGLIGSTLLFMFSEYYWELLIARFLQGISDACVWTLGMCLISDTFPIEELGTQMGRVMTFHSIGMVAGAPIGALYQTRGYKAPFIFCVALAGVDLVLRLFLVERKNNPPEWFKKQNEQRIEESRTATIDSSVPEKKDTVSYWMLLKQHRLLAGMLMAFSNGTLLGVLESTLNVRLASEWGLNSGQIGVVFIAAVAPTFVASPLAGYLADKLGAKVVVIPTWIIGSVATILMGVPNKSTAGGIAPLIILTVIQGFCVAAFLTPVLSEMGHVVQSLNPDGSDDGQGRSYALFNVAFALGGIVGPFLGGYLYKAIGFFWVNVVMGCFLLVCAPYVFVFIGERGKFIVRQKRNEDEPIRSEDTEVYAAKTEMKPMEA